MRDLRLLRLFGGAVLLLSTALLSGCAISYSLPGASAKDEDFTGSIASPNKTLSPRLGAEDWRRARASLGVALDPQSNGAAAKWDNPETKLSGSFHPTALAYPIDGKVCRPFLAKVDSESAREEYRGVACRERAEEWTIQESRAIK